jgi:threonine aldolase
MMTVDLRSDTLSQPTEAMRLAMMEAMTGDDVFGEDPSVNALEAMAAVLFGREAALYCPSGTMSNQIAIKAHTQPGDEVICESSSHVYLYEGGGIAFNSGCQAKLITGDRGRLTVNDLAGSINPDDVHKPRTRLLSLENTSNRGGGSCYEMDTLQEIRKFCTANDIGLHLDGARLFNALVAKKQSPKEFGAVFDSISICLNKGLGCPMGSLLIGNKDFIQKARRIRKVLGGGMRQAGFMAATGIHALKFHIDRLKEDHQHAQQLAAVIAEKPYCKKLFPVETNIIIFEVAAPYTANSLVELLASKGIHAIAMSPVLVRLVLYLNIGTEQVTHTCDVLRTL